MAHAARLHSAAVWVVLGLVLAVRLEPMAIQTQAAELVVAAEALRYRQETQAAAAL